MGMLTHALGQTAKIITTTVDKYGDQVPTAEAEVACRFRYITEVGHNENREDIDNADAMIWFEPGAAVVEGTIVYVDGNYWRIDRLIKARKMSGDTVYFLKAFVVKHELSQDLS